MSEARINTYEGMFLFPQAVTANLQDAVDHIKSILDRGEAEILSFRKWDERRLAYEIKGNKRGVYFLTYFKAPADKLRIIERDCNLSEQMLRAMIVRAEHLPQEQIEAAEGMKELADEIELRKKDPAASSSEGTSRVESASTPAPSATTPDRDAPKEDERTKETEEAGASSTAN